MQRNKEMNPIPIQVHWSGDDTKNGKVKLFTNTSGSQFNTEFECEFLGSIDVSPI